MPDCIKCSNIWKERYYAAEKSYTTMINRLILIALTSALITFVCIILTLYFGIKTQRFISGFEYVEETSYEIEQHEGQNAAIIGNESEVNIVYGTDSESNEKEVLAKKEECNTNTSTSTAENK